MLLGGQDAGGAAGHGGGARHVPASARERLETSLAGGAGAGRPRRRLWGVSPSALGAAAVLVMGLAVGVPLLAHGGHRTNLSAASDQGRPSSTAAAHRGAPAPAPRAGATYSRAGTTSTTSPKKALDHQYVVRKAPGGAAGPASKPPMAAPGAGKPAVVPSSGPAAGGNWAVLKGAGLGKSTVVLFGTVKARRAQVVSAHELRVLVPAHRPGPVEVKVERAGQDSAPAAVARYRFEPAA
jgi:hypothetical protein